MFQPMSKKITYTDEPLGDLKVGSDFLPRPEELVFRDQGGKVRVMRGRKSPQD